MLRELKVYLLLTHLSLLGTTRSASLLQRLCYRCRLSRSGVNYHPPTSQAKEKRPGLGVVVHTLNPSGQKTGWCVCEF